MLLFVVIRHPGASLSVAILLHCNGDLRLNTSGQPDDYPVFPRVLMGSFSSIFFFSISTPACWSTSAISAEVTEPNSRPLRRRALLW